MVIFCHVAYCGVDTWLTYFFPYLLLLAISEAVNCSLEFVTCLRVKPSLSAAGLQRLDVKSKEIPSS